MVNFYKYQGAGNDFILIDNRNEFIIESKKVELAKGLCERKFGIGSDGIIFIENTNDSDFKMDFLNPDGSRSFCGNGSRCAVRFAKDIEIFSSSKISFLAIDGIHKGFITDNHIKIEMKDVDVIDKINDSFFMNTGSPHYVSYLDAVGDLDVVKYGREIRYSNPYKEEGTNVNFVQEITPMNIKVRTYERGVEGETLACGTGVTACVLSYALKNNVDSGVVDVQAVGGDLKVYFEKKENDSFQQIWLEGPAEFVFKGEINV